ncbi:hypothetical protein ACH4GK_27960 [Streptomyces rimosus]|uniref:hypothetical protein n=1 Tax=Streptomyces rimosus TaxID=1927 RepID=UPI00067C57CB|nr:hypothetical protein [Streptomyces rimosus]
MPEPQDPLRSLFQQAADAGQDRVVAAPVAEIAARGRRARRRRVAALVTVACLVCAGGGATAAALLSRPPAPVGPAGPPAGRPTPDRLPAPEATASASSPPPTPTATISESPTDGALPTDGASRGTATEPPP